MDMTSTSGEKAPRLGQLSSCDGISTLTPVGTRGRHYRCPENKEASLGRRRSLEGFLLINLRARRHFRARAPCCRLPPPFFSPVVASPTAALAAPAGAGKNPGAVWPASATSAGVSLCLPGRRRKGALVAFRGRGWHWRRRGWTP